MATLTQLGSLQNTTHTTERHTDVSHHRHVCPPHARTHLQSHAHSPHTHHSVLAITHSYHTHLCPSYTSYTDTLPLHHTLILPYHPDALTTHKHTEQTFLLSNTTAAHAQTHSLFFTHSHQISKGQSCVHLKKILTDLSSYNSHMI